MKPRLGALMLLASILLLVGLVPTVAGARPTASGAPSPAAATRQIQHPPTRAPQPRPELDEETLLVPTDEPVDPRLAARRAQQETQPLTRQSAPQMSNFEPQITITEGPERIPATVLPDAGNSAYSPSVSANGRYIAFWSSIGNLVPNDVWNHPDIFVYDTQDSTVERISVPPSGVDIWGFFSDPSISDDGRYVAFSGYAQELAGHEDGWNSDIYVHDRNDGTSINISMGYNGDEATGNSYHPAISPDGDFVVFMSNADNLVPDDFNGFPDIFLYDMSLGTLERVSVDSNELESDGDSYEPVVSNGGLFVAYYSYATNLVADDTNEWGDVFLRDVAAGTTTRISVNADGDEANEDSYLPDITPDGRYIAYESYATNLVDDDINDDGYSDIFIYDRQEDETHLVSLDESGDPIYDYSSRPTLSNDGTLVAFDTWAGLAAADNNNTGDIYIADWAADTLVIGSINSNGDIPDNASVGAALSGDGNVVAFESYATDLVLLGDPDDLQDVYARNLTTETNFWASKSNFPYLEPNSDTWDMELSADGRYVAFTSLAGNLVPFDTNGANDVFMYDRQTSQTTLISVTYWGGEAYGPSNQPSISDDGQRIVFMSLDQYIVPDDGNGYADIFVYDVTTGTTERVSVDSSGSESNDTSDQPTISGDGNVVAFVSGADNLVDDDTNGFYDVFIHDLTTGETRRVSVDSSGNESNSSSSEPSLSENGRYVAFSSYADNLVENDTNGYADVFVHDLVTGETSLISTSYWGGGASSESWGPAISADGRFVAFDSYANDLVADDENWANDIFLHDRQSGKTVRVSQAYDGGETDSDSYAVDMSADGRYFVFGSYASNLIADATTGYYDIFMHDRLTGETVRISESESGEGGNDYSNLGVISADGSTVAFDSWADNIVPDDSYPYLDVFVVEQSVDDTTLYTVSGTVLDDQGNPIEGVIINPVSAPSNFAVTDGDGEYVLELPAGTYDLMASEEYYEFIPGVQEVSVGPNQPGIDFTGVYKYGRTLYIWANEDAYVDEAKKTTNFGSAPIMRVKNAGKDMNAYLKFEVSGLDSVFPGTCRDVDNAWIRTFVKEPSTDGGSIYVVDNGWSENTLTWNNAPAISGAPVGSIGPVVDESYYYTTVSYPIETDGTYSFAIRNNVSNSVDYSTREGDRWVLLGINYDQDTIRIPEAYMDFSNRTGIAPFTVQFTDSSEGCATSWLWDFGDGTTSTEQNPSHTYTTIGEYEVSLTVTNGMGSDTVYEELEVVGQPDRVFLSLLKKATLNTLVVEPGDIVLYDKFFNSWTMVYDGSVRGTKANIGSFEVEYGGDLLIVFSSNQDIPGLGKATPYDVVRFTPDTPHEYPLGPGSYSWEFQGKPTGLTTSGEKIDAFAAGYGDWYFSTSGAATLPTNPVIKAADEDLLVWPTWAGGWNHIGLDGSTIAGLAGEDIAGAAFDDDTGNLYVVISGSFKLGSVTGNDSQIVHFDPNGGSLWQSDTQWSISLLDWLAPGAIFKGKIDAIDMERSSIMIEE